VGRLNSCWTRGSRYIAHNQFAFKLPRAIIAISRKLTQAARAETRKSSNAGRQELSALAGVYYHTTHDAIRRYKTQHLILGDRYEAHAPLPSEVVNAAWPFIVLSFQVELPCVTRLGCDLFFCSFLVGSENEEMPLRYLAFNPSMTACSSRP
jgi:hypothetical protein